MRNVTKIVCIFTRNLRVMLLKLCVFFTKNLRVMLLKLCVYFYQKSVCNVTKIMCKLLLEICV